MPILLNKMSTKGGRGGHKSLKSCLRSKSMTPYILITILLFLAHIVRENRDCYTDERRGTEMMSTPKSYVYHEFFMNSWTVKLNKLKYKAKSLFFEAAQITLV